MKQKRNSNVSNFFWATLILLIILGILIKHFNINQISYPSESDSSSSSISIESDIATETIEDFFVETSTKETIENLTSDIPSSEENSTTLPTENNNNNSPTEILDETASFDVISKDENNTSNDILQNETNSSDDISQDELDTSIEISQNEINSSENTSLNENCKGTIYLTFDDGPSIECTSQILDILKQNNIKATFFILDYEFDSEKEDLVLRSFNEGHSIALHGTSHDYSKIYSSLDNLIENFQTLEEKVFTTTGYHSNIIRFPGGSSNTVSKNYCLGIMTDAVDYFSTTDFKYFDWNVDSQDAGGAFSAEEIFENVTSEVKEGRNNIVLMHDSSSKIYTVQALQDIIDWALSEGYKFDKITEETPQVTHKIAN